MALAQRLLGKTGIKLPSLGFGAAPLGQKFYNLNGDPKEIVDRAISVGVNYFDTSPYYGASEEALGRALSGRPRDQFILSTKLGRLDADRFDYSPSWIQKSVERSLKLLGVSHIDILLLHDVEYLPDVRPINEESLPALNKLKQSGLVRAIGFSCYPLQTMRDILSGVNSELVDVVLSYAHNNLLNNSLLDLAGDLKQKEVGLIDASPLALGLLRDQPPPDWHKAPANLRRECLLIAEELAGKGMSLQAVALNYAIRHTPGASLLVGMGSADEVSRNSEVFLQAESAEYTAVADEIRRRLAPWKSVNLS